jgi:hypothetical protein
MTTDQDVEAEIATALANMTSARDHLARKLERLRGQLPAFAASVAQLQANLERLRHCMNGRQYRNHCADVAVLARQVEAIRGGGAVASFEAKLEPYVQTLHRIRRRLLGARQTERQAALARTRYVARRFNEAVLNLQPTTLQEAGLTFVDVDVCPRCQRNLEYQHNDCIVRCPGPGCGYRSRYFDNSTRTLAFGEIYYDYQTFYYQRIHHFKACMTKFQAKEPRQVPHALMYAIMAVMYNQGSRTNASVTHVLVHAVCEYLYLSTYYDNAVQIHSRITNAAPPRMLPHQEAACLQVFKAIQEPYHQFKASDRNNLFPYPYMLYKACELHGYTEFLPYFPLLKDYAKLKKHDAVWEAICQHYAHLGWRYIESQPSEIDDATASLRATRKLNTIDPSMRSTRRQRQKARARADRAASAGAAGPGPGVPHAGPAGPSHQAMEAMTTEATADATAAAVPSSAAVTADRCGFTIQRPRHRPRPAAPLARPVVGSAAATVRPPTNSNNNRGPTTTRLGFTVRNGPRWRQQPVSTLAFT